MYTVLYNPNVNLYWPVECSNLQELYILYPHEHWQYPYFDNGDGLVNLLTAKMACYWADCLKEGDQVFYDATFK